MSFASDPSYQPRRFDSSRSNRSRVLLRAQQNTVYDDDAYTFALRVAYLHYLLQPQGKRKQWVAAPKPAHRSHSSVNDIIGQFASDPSSAIKFPSSFRLPLERRISQVVQGNSPLPGYNDAAVKRTFAQAWVSVTSASFQKAADKDRKIEPYILMFYSAATKAAKADPTQAAATDDDALKLLCDRHIALFVRLVSYTFRDKGWDRDRPDLMERLSSLENKLLTNDQNLAAATSQDGGKMIEVPIPLSYEVKDMPMVLLVSRVFGRSNTEVQADIDRHRPTWTEGAALQDMKAYQHRLNTNAAGSLKIQDFDLDEAFEEWKRWETPNLANIILDILKAKPELRASSSSNLEKPLPGRPQSIFADDRAYADLSRALSSSESTAYSFDNSLSLSSLSLDDTASSIRSVDDSSYTFIPPEPRAYYRSILHACLTYDSLHSEPNQPYTPLSKQSMEFLVELSVYWRVPQFSRLIATIEVASTKFVDRDIGVGQLATILDFVKTSWPDMKKSPHIHQYSCGLDDINRTSWTVQDFAVYQQTLNMLHDTLLDDLADQLKDCYGPSPPDIGSLMLVLDRHILNDPAFSAKPDHTEAFARQVNGSLKITANDLYRSIVESVLPEDAGRWQFSHVIAMGKDVMKLVNKINKRYRRAPDIMGVTPISILSESLFPLFERDAQHIIQGSMDSAQRQGEEIDIDDGFTLYGELVSFKSDHANFCPHIPFAFDIEELLEGFVWRWVHNAGTRMEEFVENAIKQDNFEVRSSNPEQPPLDAERHSVSIVDLFMLFRQTTSQIENLSWNNELHHARFMTTLAHAFASGIGRYCEEVGRIFAADMDRLSPQELAAAQRTTQEKFLQYAKEAWNTKEKPEPFNFNSKVFVMLNNIEYAKQELDKLEHSMNVDTCAEIIREAEGPKPKKKKPNKYNFTVKIVEAEDLKACDPNGLSDPYVVLVDERQKRLHKTRVVRKSLNPRWDEARDIAVTAPITIIATVWDDDMFGDHDFVGRTSFKLDPVHFSDYIPREIWLDLDTQGRILVKVSMEGEREDIEFQFGKAFRDLKRTEQAMVRKITEKLRDQINETISHDTLRGLVRGQGIGASVTSLWKKRTSAAPAALSRQDMENSLNPLCDYFFDNFSIMSQTLTKDTMRAVMIRLWKEVLMAVEGLLVPPLSDKPSDQRPLTQKEIDIVYVWLEALFKFFNAKDETGAELGVVQNDLRSPKWHELATLNFFYFEDTNHLIRESERMAAATAHRAQQMLTQQSQAQNRLSTAAPFTGPSVSTFASMGTIRRGKSIMMSRNLGTMRRAKEEKRKEIQADPSDDMILRILRMRPEAAGYLKERSRQKERQTAAAAAALIVKNSVNQGWNAGGIGGAPYARLSSPRR